LIKLTAWFVVLTFHCSYIAGQFVFGNLHFATGEHTSEIPVVTGTSVVHRFNLYRNTHNQGTLSGKYYDDTQFFSPQMLFGRFTNNDRTMDTLFPAYEGLQ
jgi:hypothetical protein